MTYETIITSNRNPKKVTFKMVAAQSERKVHRVRERGCHYSFIPTSSPNPNLHLLQKYKFGMNDKEKEVTFMV